jgi:signal transduction histidine kinase
MQQEQRVNQNQKSSGHLFAGLHFSPAGTMIARVVWVVFAIGLLVLSGGGLLADYAQAQIPCQGSNCAIGQITVGNVIALHRLGLPIPLYELYPFIFSLVVSGILFLVSCVIFWRRSDQWFPYFVSLWLLVGAAVPIVGPYSSLFPSQVMGVIANGLVIVLFTAFGVFCVTFPNGQFAPRWSWLIPLLWILQLIAFLAPPPFNITNWPGPLFPLEALLVYGSTLVLQVYRYKQVYNRAERQQTKWLVYGLAIAVLYVLCFFVLSAVLSPDSPILLFLPPVPLLLALCVGLAIGAALLRYHLWDIDLIINRTLVYGTLSASVIGLYVLIVGYFGVLFRASSTSVIAFIATAVVAIVFQPLRGLLQQAVNRLMYGERDDPYAVLARLGSRLEATLVPERVLPAIVETVAQALKLPYVAIALLPEQHPDSGTDAWLAGAMPIAGAQEADVVASYGSPVPDPLRIPLAYQAETIGYFLLAPRAGDTFSKADHRLLTDLARQAGVAVYAVRLTAHLKQLTESLQQARELLVTTREEERRRLRRDLHDGLGPALASFTFKVDAARNSLKQDSEKADRLLQDVRQQAQEAIIDVRRLVYNLRPPALDELGLLSALREQAANHQHMGLEIVFEAPPVLPPLPAAIEVAIYRIAQEALTNVARHAQSQHCLLRLRINQDACQLEISDDGKGIPPGPRVGVGLQAMRERASELGGTCTIISGSGGTTIRVRLPLSPARGSDQDTKPQERLIALTNDMNSAGHEE